jgi:hypothetical protein
MCPFAAHPINAGRRLLILFVRGLAGPQGPLLADPMALGAHSVGNGLSGLPRCAVYAARLETLAIAAR